MTADRTPEYLAGLVRELCKLPHETEWLEFKGSNADPREIGEYISAMANAAAIDGKAFAYLHACLRYVTRQPMTNSSVRERFGIAEKNASAASRLLNEAVAGSLIVVEDTAVGTRARTYLPYWAAPRVRREEFV